MAYFIEKHNGKEMVYDSLIVEPKKLSIFGSELSLKIINELVNEPCCAMDLARRLNQHEQKIYYHLRKLETAGIIRHVRSEKRYSMTAKIYDVVSPIIAAKVHNNGGEPLKKKAPSISPKLKRFMDPFVKDGTMNALMIMGDPYPHGEHDAPARGSVHCFDFALLLGTMLNSTSFPHYELDTDVMENDLKNNLILFNSPKANIVLDKVNEHLPIRFDMKGEWKIISTYTGKTYDDPRVGLIAKWDNPFEKGKKVLVIAGIRTRGIRAAVLALTKHFDKVYESVRDDGNLVRVVQGLDKSGRKVIDSVKFLE